MSEVLLNSPYALWDCDKYFSVLSLVRSKAMFDSTSLIIGSKVTARKCSFGPFVLFGLLIGARIPFPTLISICYSKHLFSVIAIA